ncbi:transposase [Carboxylicivirga sp. M1479]|uniref:transposase n=1 Tax=Carboxylicivirga sp. M1479 TaxID=2594476 RepID=UPI001C8F3808|nr:transposase [Carboxylicivirga sp. M1479]
MIKLQSIPEFQAHLPLFSIEDNFQVVYNQFLASSLGKIYQAIPWDELADTFGLSESKMGPDCTFSPQGKLALMFLKNYACCSDKRLMEQFNSNIHYQLFCRLLLGIGEEINNFKIISQIRCELAAKLDIDKAQKCLARHWLPYMEELDQVVTDATCYESSLRFPTDVKLLWEATDWCQNQLKLLCSYGKQAMPRCKYNKWKQRYWNYSRKRRKPKKERIAITRGVLKLLKKLHDELAVILKQQNVKMPGKYYTQYVIIEKVLEQQNYKLTTGKSPENRIVSLSKSYIRPIVRGKETKAVEFGAKVNKIQINGISFIQQLSFDAFNEGAHFKASVYLAQSLTHTKVKIAGADAIYATNANRKFASSNNIRTDFVRKGRAGKHEHQRKQLAAQIKKERATKLEGSFGKDKQHYYLNRIKARTKDTEILWIFMGIHVGNALEIGRRMWNQASLAA